MRHDPNRRKFRKLRKGHAHGLQWYAIKGCRTLVCIDTVTGDQLHVVPCDGFWVVTELAPKGEAEAPVAFARRWQARQEVESILFRRARIHMLFMGVFAFASATGLAASREWARGLQP